MADDLSHYYRMAQLHEDLTRIVEKDSEQELDEPATPMMLASVRSAHESLPLNNPLRAGLEIELITMEQISGAGDPIRLVDLLLIVGQLKAELPSFPPTRPGVRFM